MSALQRLIEHWKTGPSKRPYIHRLDEPFLRSRNVAFEDHLTPYPYVGDLARARVWILMLNPSVADSDEADEATPYFDNLKQRNLAQAFDGVEYPLFALDPALRGTGTYSYYNNKRGFGRLVKVVGEQRRISEEEARRFLSSRIAILELLPYRSTGFPAAAAQLPSVNLARAAAREALTARTLIVPWKAGEWGLDRITDHKLFKGANRSFSFAPGGTSGFGEAILAAASG